jgi:hypothetical protein
MTFTEKIKHPQFWPVTFKVALTFFGILIIISLLFNSFSALIRFDFAKVAEENFTDGKWLNFFGIKLLVSLVYAIWTTSRNIK